MIYRKFSLGVTVYALVIAVSGTLCLWAFGQEHLFVARFTFFVFWMLGIGLLIRYVNANNRSLERFLDVLNGNDRLGSMDQKGKSFRNLNEAFNNIMDTLSKARIEKEEQFLFFRTAIEQVGVGLLAFDQKGKVILFNAGAKKLLGVSYLHWVKDLNRLHPRFEEFLFGGNRNGDVMIPVLVEGKLRKLSVRITEFRLRGELLHMVSFQDIRSELEAGEADAWQKLIRVITHEIMNSITPMKTLSTTLLKTFECGGEPCAMHQLDEQKIRNAHLGLTAIKKRSEGLAQFVQSYRNITRIPQPDIKPVRISLLFREVEQLIGEEMRKQNVDFRNNCPFKEMEILLDEQLIVQVLINLLRNALNAVEGMEQPQIELGAQVGTQGNAILFVQDNGRGIDPEARDQIFVPFFTTRSEGSGIGLSFSRQVMRLHKGNIGVQSEPGNGARFELQF